jgi:hypothetical protein
MNPPLPPNATTPGEEPRKKLPDIIPGFKANPFELREYLTFYLALQIPFLWLHPHSLCYWLHKLLITKCPMAVMTDWTFLYIERVGCTCPKIRQLTAPEGCPSHSVAVTLPSTQVRVSPFTV